MVKHDTIQHYKILSEIGKGGMGEVYLAEDTRLDRRVAIKVLLDDVSDDAERVQRFIQEAKAASALNHPNILTVYEIGEASGHRYIATEYIEGETLGARMRRGELGINEALGIALQVAAALGAAHEAGIIHRDVKPENIMIRSDGLVKVLDFGLAKLTEIKNVPSTQEDATRAMVRTQPGLVMGTVAYMSPEQARGLSLDSRSDIFSLGIVMYEIFTGRLPFDGEVQMDLVSSILKDDPTPIRQLSPDLPRQLERIVNKTLRKDREHRYHHVKDLEIDLGDLRDELKFESKRNRITEVELNAHVTMADEPRKSTLTESISTTRRFTLLHLILFTLVAFSLIGTAWYLGLFGSDIAAGPVKFKSTEIASWSSAAGEISSNARFSPDGKMIAFSSTKSGTKNIWVMQSASSEAIQVTNDQFSNEDPVWSPKGDEIAFYSQKGNVSDGKGIGTGIWRIPALGGTPKSVAAIEDGSFELRRWTASGKIYVQSRGELQAVDIATGVPSKVTSFGEHSGKVLWVNISPDEKTLAFVITKDGKWQLFNSNIENTDPRLAAEGTGDVKNVAWLPEKNRYYFSSSVNDVFQVFQLSGSSKPRQLTSTDTDSIVVDADGESSSIIVSSAKEESNIWKVGLTEKQESPIAKTVNSELWPMVSSNGERVVYQSAKNMSRGNNLFESSILVKSLKDRESQPVEISASGYLPVWSPDDSTVAYFRSNAGTFELFTANPNGGGERRAATGGIPAIGYSVSPYNLIQTRAFAWSPDSKMIAYLSNKSGSSNIWTVAINGGLDVPTVANTDPDTTLTCPIWSSNGKRVAFMGQKKAKDENGQTIRFIGYVDLEKGQNTTIYSATGTFRLIGWTNDEKGLLIAVTDKVGGLRPETLLKKIETENKSETKIATLKNAYFYNIFQSNDRSSIAFAARNDDLDDIWVVPVAGGEARKITNNNDSALYYSRLTWLPDGTGILFGKQTRFGLLSLLSDIQ